MLSSEINELPDRVRKYIAALETECDPAGTIRENFRLGEENAGLRLECEWLAEDRNRLDWLDQINRRTNEHYGTKYGWKFDINHNRAALTDHNFPVLTVREAIDDAKAAIARDRAAKLSR